VKEDTTMNDTGESFAIRPDLVFREEEDGAFLFNPRTNALHCLNKVGAFICALCDGKHDLATIYQGLMEAFEVNVESREMRKDVETFLDRMISLNLLERRK
jgi:hypothetical protein